MADLDLVGLGLSTLDVLMRMGTLPAWDAPQRISDFGLDGGGPVGTACVAAARLGARVGYVGPVGNDLVGELKTRLLATYGVDLSHLVPLDEPDRQVVGVYVHAETGERMFSVVEGLFTTPLSVAALDRAYFQSARFLHLDGFYHECALQAAAWLHEVGGRVCLDCRRTDEASVPERTLELLRSVDVLVCGSGFCRALTGEADIWAAGPAARACGPAVVVETQGDRGSYTFSGDEAFHTPAYEVEVLDTTGAGDVFHGAYLVAQLHGWDLRLTAQFASAASALKCAKLGGRRGIPDFAETVAFLRERGVTLP
jgi:sulfofructose kinase